MTDEEALLAAIVASPDDDLPRLVYADWLDEHGQPERAEFIRVQIELARLTARGQSDQSLSAREHQLLLLQKRKPWDPAGPLVFGRCQYHRGFVRSVAVHASTYVSVAEHLLSLAPVRDVWVEEAERRFADVSLVPRPPTARVRFETGRRTTRGWRRATVDVLNPDLTQLEDHVTEGRWVVAVWARWSGDQRRAVENGLDRAEDIARSGATLGIRPLNLAVGLGPLFPMLEDPFAAPRWLLLQNGYLAADSIGAWMPEGWLTAVV